MKQLWQWLTGLVAKHQEKEAPSHADRMEDAGVVWQMADGTFMCQCCVCGKRDDLPCDISEIDESYEHYCGGSPSCCP